jgi:hypothetical protein
MSPDTRYIAFGAGGAFQNIVLNGLLPVRFEYAVDNHFSGDEFHGVSIRRPAALADESRDGTTVVIFAMSSSVYRLLRSELLAAGFGEKQIVYYGDLFFDGLERRLKDFGVPLSPSHYAFARSASMTFPIDCHSSFLGTALLLGLINASGSQTGAVAELGAYKGGNALLANLIVTLEGSARAYCIVDSFEGFPALSPNDPAESAGMFRDASHSDIVRMFEPFPQVHVYRGFIPEILSELPERKYSVVYYDCDLYQPAVDSLDYFFPRLESGGFLLIHDYLPKLGGFDGVRKAADAFLETVPGVDCFEVPETTHLIVRKP